jgi:transcriptional regulator with XRE-family HTH domain
MAVIRVGPQIAEFRRSRRMSQERLALAIGSTQSSIARIEKGTSLPNLGTLHRIAEALGAHLEIRLVQRAG